MKNRALGLDLGDVRIGVAVSDELGWTARGLTFIKRKNLKSDLAEIQKILDEFGNVDRLIVGMPFNMDGSEGERVKKTREFIEKLKGAFGLPIVEVDERLTTWEAEKVLIDADVSRKKRKDKIDQLAAALILQNYLDQNQK